MVLHPSKLVEITGQSCVRDQDAAVCPKCDDFVRLRWALWHMLQGFCFGWELRPNFCSEEDGTMVRQRWPFEVTEGALRKTFNEAVSLV